MLQQLVTKNPQGVIYENLFIDDETGIVYKDGIAQLPSVTEGFTALNTPLFLKTTEVSAAQFNDLVDNPVVLIPAQGTDVLIDVIDVIIQFKYGTNHFTTTDAFPAIGYGSDTLAAGLLSFGDSTTAILRSNYSVITGILYNTSQILSNGSVSDTYSLDNFVNQPITLINTGSNTDNGQGSSVIFNISYRPITLSI